jgi:hypothetical protein
MKKATALPPNDQRHCTTGIPGLDEVLVEGLPSNCF